MVTSNFLLKRILFFSLLIHVSLIFSYYKVGYIATAYPNKKNELIAEYKKLRNVLVQEPECLSFKIISCEGSNLQIEHEWTSYEEYKSHLTQSFLQRLIKKIDALTDSESYYMGHFLPKNYAYTGEIIKKVIASIGMALFLWQLHHLDWKELLKNCKQINPTLHLWYKYLKTPLIDPKKLKYELRCPFVKPIIEEPIIKYSVLYIVYWSGAVYL